MYKLNKILSILAKPYLLADRYKSLVCSARARTKQSPMMQQVSWIASTHIGVSCDYVPAFLHPPLTI